MSEKLSLLLLFGGISSEHEVSCVSAASILNHIDSEKYEINTVGITKEGNWFLTGSPAARIQDGSWQQEPGNKRAFLSPDRSIGGILVEEENGDWSAIEIDVVLPMLHGKNGEDGTMQGLLQLAGLPFVGSGTAASAASMDKAITKAMVKQTGAAAQADCYVTTLQHFTAEREETLKKIKSYFNDTYPLFIKPANAGSSVGISKVKTAEELPKALEIAFAEDSKVLIEETIVGREIEVAVLGNEHPEASCIGEIFAANEFYDYNAKYQNEASKTGIVTDLTPEKEQEIRETAIRVYQTMGCRGLSRIDFFLEESGRVVLNELNTLPGFTSISMYPQLWEHSGIPYGKLIDKLVQLALEEHR